MVVGMTDVMIIGGGPAGVSAALTAIQRGHTAAIISTGPEGSALWKAERIDNYPGVPSVKGSELVEALAEQARAAGAEMIHGRALSVTPMGESFGIAVGADFHEARAVILAVGITAKSTFPGEREHLGAGVSYCATCDGMLYRGKRVAVVGLSEDAPEEAQFLRSIGCEVEYFDKSRARKYEIRGEERADTLVADGVEYAVDGVFILRAGVAPDSLVPGLEIERGAIVTGDDMSTSVSGVFACGDCAGTPYQIAKAVGDGNVAALSAAKYLART